MGENPLEEAPTSDKQGEDSLSKEEQRKAQKTVIDELEFIEDEKERFWKTPSSSRMVRGGTMMLTFDIIGSVFFSFYMMQLGRATTEDASLLAIIDTLGVMLRFFAYLGFTGAGSKFLSEYLTRDKDTARIYAKSAAKYNMWVTGFPLIITSIVIYFVAPTNDIERLAYFCLMITIIFDRLTSNITIYVIGHNRYDLYAYAYYIPFAGMYISAMITYPIFGVAGPIVSFSIARIVIFFLMLIMMKKCSDFPISDLFDWKHDYGLFWKLFSFNFLYSLANLAFALLTSTLLITGGRFFGVLTPQEIVAIYTISTFSNMLMNLFSIVGPIMVSVSEASGMKNKKLVENYVHIALKFPILMVIAVLTFFILFGPEMIEIFYGPRWITMGMLIMSCLMIAYCFGSFASKYDNILAGIGRPETVVIPWMVALVIALLGLIIATFLPADVYLVDDIITYKGETLNYGISIRFTFALIAASLGLFIGGLWIVKICLKVLGVKIPAHYIWKPVLVALITGVVVKLLLLVIPVRLWVDGLLGEFAGGIAFTVIMVLIGLIIFLTLAILMDVMNREDGKFWMSIIGGMGPAKKLITPLLIYIKFLLKHQIKRFKTPPKKWILATDKETLAKDSQFKVNVQPLTKGVTLTKSGVEIEKGQKLEFQIDLNKINVPLYNVIFYARIDFTKVPASLQYLEEVRSGEDVSVKLEFEIPE
jgi:O-antigen/teichoic acid export membrane protein